MKKAFKILLHMQTLHNNLPHYVKMWIFRRISDLKLKHTSSMQQDNNLLKHTNSLIWGNWKLEWTSQSTSRWRFGEKAVHGWGKNNQQKKKTTHLHCGWNKEWIQFLPQWRKRFVAVGARGCTSFFTLRATKKQKETKSLLGKMLLSQHCSRVCCC